MKKFTFFLFLIFYFSFYISPLYAQSSSPSGSLIQKLDELKKDIASKAAEIKTAVNKKVQDKAVIGKILKIEDGSILIQTLSSVKKVNLDEFTQFIGLNAKKIKLSTLELEDNVASLGDFDDKNDLAAKKIIYLESDSWRTATSSGELVWGQIQKSQEKTISLKNKAGETEDIVTSGQTVFMLGNNEAAIVDAKPEKFMVARGTRLKDGTFKAKFVYFIPSVGFVKPSIKSTSSGEAKE